MVQKRSAFFIALAVALLAAVAWWLAPVDEDQARWDDYLSRLERLAGPARTTTGPATLSPQSRPALADSGTSGGPAGLSGIAPLRSDDADQ